MSFSLKVSTVFVYLGVAPPPGVMIGCYPSGECIGGPPPWSEWSDKIGLRCSPLKTTSGERSGIDW